jgi:hypothetical protein
MQSFVSLTLFFLFRPPSSHKTKSGTFTASLATKTLHINNMNLTNSVRELATNINDVRERLAKVTKTWNAKRKRN